MKDNGVKNGEAVRELDDLLKKWSETLPQEFTLGTMGNGSADGARHRYPDLHFKADGTIPGLYYADLDPQSLLTNGNGHAESTMDFKDDAEEN